MGRKNVKREKNWGERTKWQFVTLQIDRTEREADRDRQTGKQSQREREGGRERERGRDRETETDRER